MKKLIALAFFAFVSAGAFAQTIANCLPAPQIMGQPPRCYDGRIIPVGATIISTAPPIAHQQYNPYNNGQMYGGAPVGVVPMGVSNGLSGCAVVGGIAGGTLGSLAHNHRGQATILGALIGGVVGQTVCSNGNGQRVIVQQPQQPVVQTMVPQQVVMAPPVPAEMQVGGYIQQSRVTRVPSDCDIDGNVELQDLKGLTPAQCAAIAKLAATRGTMQGDTVAQAPSTPVTQTTGTTRIPACTVNTGEKIHRFNAVNGVKFGKAECLRYLDKSLPLPAESDMSILP